jgi:hypothetical protein
MRLYQIIGIVLGASVLCIALGSAFLVRSAGASSEKDRGALSGLLPRAIEGVVIQDIPLGSNESVDAAAKEIMAYDDVVSRRYIASSGVFSVYIGYWVKGKRSPVHVASHTPDRCWVLNGMTCLESSNSYLLRSSRAQVAPGHWRRFRDTDGAFLHVVYWHRVGGSLLSYGNPARGLSMLGRGLSVVHDLFFLRECQYFVRIVGDGPLEKFGSDVAFNEVLERIAVLGIWD